MSLNGILGIGRSGLMTHQSAIANAASNSANASTPGFARREVSLVGLPNREGVAIGSVTRRADHWLQASLLGQRTSLGAEQAKAAGLTGLQTQFAEGEGSLGSALDKFFGSLRTLATLPTDNQARQSALSQTQSLVDTINSTANRIASERSQADAQLQSAAEDVSALLEKIAELNGSIARAQAAGGGAEAERDQRDRLLEELSTNVPINVLTGPDGTMTVLLAGGRSLVQGSEHAQLQAVQDPALGGLSRIELVDASGLAANVTQAVSGGAIGGLLELRDDVLADAAERLDQFAFDFSTSINAVHSVGFGLDGVTGRNLFAPPAAVAGAATSLSLAPGITPDWIAAADSAASAAGGNANLLALAAVADDASVAGGGTRTLGEEVAAMVAAVGFAASTHQTRLATAEVQVTQAQDLLDSQQGVSIDEELIDITRFERAYQAAARIVQTVDEMFQTILQL